jgi:hypothetical protein
LESPPHRAIKKLSMIGSRHYDDVARKLIELHEQERDNPLYLTSFVRIAPFLSDRVELVKEENARASANVVKKRSQPRIRLSKEAADQSVIANYVQGQSQSFSHCLSERSLAVARGPREQDPMPRLVTVSP